MKTKHTPGPWAVYENKGSTRLRIMSDAVPYDVATMNHAGSEEAEAANAALVAAAPELLVALKAILDGGYWDDDGDYVIPHKPRENDEDTSDPDCLVAAGAAIAKAEGRA